MEKGTFYLYFLELGNVFSLFKESIFERSVVGETQMERCPGVSPRFFRKKSPDSVKWAMMTYVDAGLFISLWGL